MCEGYGKWCKFCDYKGYLKKKMIKCPSCNGVELNSIVCPLCDNKLMLIDSENAYFEMELTPHSHPSRDTIKQFIFFKHCNHFHQLSMSKLSSKCQFCNKYSMNIKGLSCSICNLSFCEYCLNSVTLDILIDPLGHKLSSMKYIIQRCKKCAKLIEDCLLFDCSICHTHICGNCLKMNPKSKILSVPTLQLE